jgi:hypothetical protein
MRTTTGPARVTVLELSPGTSITVYRIVRSEVRDDPVLVNSLRSNYELGQEPRRVERSSTVIHMGISTYLGEGAARGTAQRFPKLGDFVARLDLTSGRGFNFAQTGHPGHLTVWGDPFKLHDVIGDIRAVSR